LSHYETFCKKPVNMKNEHLHILLAGTLPPPIGGTSVSFQILVDLLAQREDISIEVLDLGKIRRIRGGIAVQLICLMYELVLRMRKVNVNTIYVASTALPTLGLIVLLVSRLLAKPFIVRKAAGFDYMELGPIRGLIAHFVVKHADLYLAQTKNLVYLARNRGISHVRWYPTSRMIGEGRDMPSLQRTSCRRFVFVGQVRQYKGIYEIIQAAERCEEGVTVDVYGPLFDDLGKGVFEKCKKVKYCGILSAENVIPTLKRYDMLLLPTKAPTEGYPGAILEAYSAGLPIITTRCGGIPEIVDENSGIFVEPGNAESLYQAMKKLSEDSELYTRLCKGVREQVRQFSAETWADQFVSLCRELHYGKKISI